MLLCINVFRQKFLLRQQRLEQRGVHVGSIRGKLIRIDGKKWLALFDAIALPDLNLSDRTPPRNKNLCSSLRGSEIANRGFLARVLCDEKKRDQNDEGSSQEPGRDFDRRRLERRHITPPLLMILKVDRLLAEQSSVARHLFCCPCERN